MDRFSYLNRIQREQLNSLIALQKGTIPKYADILIDIYLFNSYGGLSDVEDEVIQHYRLKEELTYRIRNSPLMVEEKDICLKALEPCTEAIKEFVDHWPEIWIQWLYRDNLSNLSGRVKLAYDKVTTHDLEVSLGKVNVLKDIIKYGQTMNRIFYTKSFGWVDQHPPNNVRKGMLSKSNHLKVLEFERRITDEELIQLVEFGKDDNPEMEYIVVTLPYPDDHVYHFSLKKKLISSDSTRVVDIGGMYLKLKDISI